MTLYEQYISLHLTRPIITATLTFSSITVLKYRHSTQSSAFHNTELEFDLYTIIKGVAQLKLFF